MYIEKEKLNSFVRQVYEDYFLPANLDIPQEMLLLDTIISLSLVACSARTEIDWQGYTVFPNIFAIKIARSGIGKDRPLAHAENDLLDLTIESIQAQYWDFVMDYKAHPYKYIQPYNHKGKVGQFEFESLDKKTQKELIDKYSPYNFQFHFENATLEGLVSQSQSMKLFGKGCTFCKNSEFGAFMNKPTDSKQDFLIGLQKGYDLQPFGGKIIKSSKQIETVSGIPIVFLGHTTDDWIKTEHDRETVMKFIRGGVGRRAFIYYPQNYNLVPVTTQQRTEGIQQARKNSLELSLKLKELYVKGAKKPVISFTQEAQDSAGNYDTEINQRVADLINSNLTSHVAELKGRFMKAVRLMGLFAFLDGKNKVSTEHVDQAIYLVDSYAEFATHFFETQELSIGEKYAQHLITNTPQSLTKNQFNKLGYIPHNQFYRAFEQEMEAMEAYAELKGYEIDPIHKGRTIKYRAKKLQLVRDQLPLMTIDAQDKTLEQLSQDTQYTQTTTQWRELHRTIKENAYMPQLVRDGKRSKKNFLPGGCLLGLDYDDGLALDDIKSILHRQGLKALVMTTKSHTPTQHRFRVLIPLKTPYTGSVDEWKTIYANLSQELGGKNDSACSDISRFYYPSPEGAEHFYTDGEPLNWRQYLYTEPPKVYKTQDAKVLDPTAHAINYVTKTYGTITEGQRDEVLNNVYAYYKNEHNLPISQVAEIVEVVNNRCLSKPFSSQYLEKWRRAR